METNRAKVISQWLLRNPYRRLRVLVVIVSGAQGKPSVEAVNTGMKKQCQPHVRIVWPPLKVSFTVLEMKIVDTR